MFSHVVQIRPLINLPSEKYMGDLKCLINNFIFLKKIIKFIKIFYNFLIKK